MSLALLVAGCSSLSDVDPVAWWHNLEGGDIAQQRPPPPNADQPYASLGSVPDKPVPTDPAARGAIATGLIADRANAQYAATLAPIPPPPPPPKPPAPVASGPDSSGATLAAASAPPPPAAPKRAPTAPVKSTDLPPPAASPDTPQVAMPDIPAAPPVAPALAGVPAITAPAAPPVAPKPVPAAVQAPRVGEPVTVAFPAGSASLPSAALPGLRLLARSRGAGRIAIVGYGDASGGAPDAQAAAMPLALARARALAAILLEAGVPSANLRIDAEAAGSGAVARLIN